MRKLKQPRKHSQLWSKLQTLQIITDWTVRTCKLHTTVKLLSIRGFAQICFARAALVTLATVWRPQKEKCVYPSQLLQKLHRQHSPNSCDEVLRGHSSGARDVNWSRSRTVDILKPHYANLTVGAVGQSCHPVYQTGFFSNIVGNLVLRLVCVVSAISFLAPGDLHTISHLPFIYCGLEMTPLGFPCWYTTWFFQSFHVIWMLWCDL